MPLANRKIHMIIVINVIREQELLIPPFVGQVIKVNQKKDPVWTMCKLQAKLSSVGKLGDLLCETMRDPTVLDLSHEQFIVSRVT